MDTIIIFLILSNLVLLGISRLGASIRMVAFQGIALGLLPLVSHQEQVEFRLVLFAVILIALKGGVFPWLLNRTLRDVKVQREMEPYIGYGLSILFGPLALGFCMWLSARLAALESSVSAKVVSAAFFTVMTGLFLIITRKKALTQVLGYLVLENGIFVFGTALAQKQPLIVELGILLDVFMAVFVMGIAMFHINREFDHIDTDRLTSLRS